MPSAPRSHLVLEALAIFLVIATSAHAVTRCRAKTLRDGTIAVTAKDVVGTPR